MVSKEFRGGERGGGRGGVKAFVQQAELRAFEFFAVFVEAGHEELVVKHVLRQRFASVWSLKDHSDFDNSFEGDGGDCV